MIFLKGAPFSDFLDLGISSYIPSGIQFCIPLFWGIFFKLGSSLIKQWNGLRIVVLLLVIFLELENIRFKLPESVQTIQISGCILCTDNFKVLEFSKIKDQKVSCCCGQLTNGKMLKRLKLKSLNIVHCVNRE